MNRLPWVMAEGTFQRMPRFRRDFTLDELPGKVLVRISGVGYYTLWLNGQRADDAHFAPTFSRYDIRTWFREIDVTHLLCKGKNRCEVQLAGGWFAGDFADVHANERASYRSVPKFAMQMFCGQKIILESDANWLWGESAVVADSPRTGETFDARRREIRKWYPAAVTAGPGGKLVRSDAPPVRPRKAVAPVAVEALEPGKLLCDFGINLTGTVRIKLCGPAGSTVILRYGELRAADGELSQANIDWYILKGECQTDRYTLAGDANGESWQPEFSYHGFRYMQAELPKGVKLLSVEAIPLRSDFSESGSMQTSDRAFNRLLEVTRRTIEANFIGYPIDCPHREKNGWLADAHLAADSVLAWFDAGPNYAEYIDTIFDYQRPDGHLPGMVPGSGHGWHWDFGIVWDSAPLLIAHTLWRRSGNKRLLRRHYRNFCNAMDFYRRLLTDGLLRVGSAEWCIPAGVPESRPAIVCSAYLYRNLRLMADIAKMLNHAADAEKFTAEADALRDKIGALKPATVSEMGALLECGLGDAGLAERLAKQARKSKFHAGFGIVGAKAVPRALAEYGYIDEALEYFLQGEFPGWQWMLEQGATTLWETWDGKQSQNHPMLGDVAGWAERYLAGVSTAGAGMRQLIIAPQFPRKLRSFVWQKKCAYGLWQVEWKRTSAETIEVQLAVPPGNAAQISLPGLKTVEVRGRKKFTVTA